METIIFNDERLIELERYNKRGNRATERQFGLTIKVSLFRYSRKTGEGKRIIKRQRTREK